MTVLYSAYTRAIPVEWEGRKSDVGPVLNLGPHPLFVIFDLFYPRPLNKACCYSAVPVYHMKVQWEILKLISFSYTPHTQVYNNYYIYLH